MSKRADPSEVIAYMRSSGAGVGTTARKFGVPETTVRRWRTAAGLDPNPAGASGVFASDLHKAPEPPPKPSRARDRELNDQVRAKLIRARDNGLDAVADPEFVRENPTGYAQVMRGLRELTDMAPELVRMERTITPPVTAGTDAASELARAMGVDPNAAPPLVALRGGQADEA